MVGFATAASIFLPKKAVANVGSNFKKHSLGEKGNGLVKTKVFPAFHSIDRRRLWEAF